MFDILGPQQELHICLQSGYSKLALAGVQEVFEFANRVLKSDIYLVRTFDSIEAMIAGRSQTNQTARTVSCIFIGGIEERWRLAHNLIGPVQHLVRASKKTGFVASGVFIAAQAGFFRDGTVAIHPNFAAAFIEEFSTIELSKTQVSVHEARYTAANGLSGIALAMKFVELDLGVETRVEIDRILGSADGLTTPMAFSTSRIDIIGARDPLVAQSIGEMRANVEHPISLQVLATRIGLSVRQVERRFMATIGASPLVTNKEIRLHHAQDLLRQTKLSIVEIGLSAGFNETSSFSRAYKKRFGVGAQNDRGPKLEIYNYPIHADVCSAA